ncbi:hypothetical protein VF03_10455, partial [Nostoc linckia z2]
PKLSAGVDTATVKKLQPSKYDEAKPWVYQEVTKVVPVSQPPSARYAQGNSSNPDQPTNTKRSRLSQSSTTSNHPLVLGARPTAMVIEQISKCYKYRLYLYYR